MHRAFATLLALASLGSTVHAQLATTVAEHVEQLADPARAGRAREALHALGEPAAQLLARQLRGATGPRDAAKATALASALDATHEHARAVLPELLQIFPELGPDARGVVLRCIANGVLWADNQALVDRCEAKLGEWVAAGLCYSQAPDQPTLLWCEYVRAVRRIKIRQHGVNPDALRASTLAIVLERERIAVGIPGPPRDQHDLTSFGRHGTRHELEAIAERGIADGDEAVTAELAKFLQFETAQPITLRRESRAGVGEPLPPNAPAAGNYPAMWRDDYRIALSRNVLARHDAPEQRRRAALHLLYSPLPSERLRALQTLRTLAPDDRETVPHLTTLLAGTDREIMREAITSLSLAGPAAASARPALRKLAEGEDKELRALARAALRQTER